VSEKIEIFRLLNLSTSMIMSFSTNPSQIGIHTAELHTPMIELVFPMMLP
jgi:hypothetical protein